MEVSRPKVDHETVLAAVASFMDLDVKDLAGYVIVGIMGDEDYQILTNFGAPEAAACCMADVLTLYLRRAAAAAMAARHN